MDKKEEKRVDQDKKNRKPLKVSELLLLTFISLREKAWAFLGALSHEETGEKEQDLKEAKLAIDCLEAIFPIVRTLVSADEIKALELDLANLRLNYVTATSKDSGGSSREEKPQGGMKSEEA